MIGIAPLIKSYDQPVVDALPAPTPITPTPAPTYQAPSISDTATVQAPMIAPPFPGQTLGKGGTPFGAVPLIYVHPLPILYDAGLKLYPYEPRAGDPDGLVPQPELRPPRPGEDAITPVPVGQQPTKPPLPVQQPQISPLPPVKGTVAGFDLAKVPFWAWLVAAAVLGAKLLK